MVKCNKSEHVPPSLVKKKYNCADVIDQLVKDFHGKCYICELDGLQDPEVEHLIPQKCDENLIYHWANLFLSCHHCNGIKSKTKYDGKIINCCKDDPELHISSICSENDVTITAKDDDEKSIMTAELIYEVFNLKNTGIRTYASKFRFDKLQEEMVAFANALEAYKNNGDLLSKKLVSISLKRSSRFAAFKREYIRNNKSIYDEFYDEVSIDGQES